MHKNGTKYYLCEKQFNMTVVDEVKNRISDMEYDVIFSYSDFHLPVNCSDAVKKALNRMAQKGLIKKYSKGRFYKPSTSVTGQMEPGRDEVVKDLLVKNGKRIGYVTGYTVFNQFGLTTALPDLIQIGARERKVKIQRGMYSISFLFQRNDITEENIPFLQLLDTVRMIKVIPDTDIDRSCIRLQQLLKEQRKDDVKRIVELAKNYFPGTRALAGALIEHVWGGECIESLYETLNPFSSYSFGINEDVLPEIKKWRIK